MLSIVDLIEAGTMSRELAAYSLAAISRGASFMVGALPGGAGKTTVMGALLNFVPREVQIVAADGTMTIEAGLREQAPRRCYVCHEIGDGSYYAYLWGKTLCRYFDLPPAGHMLATNLHADTYSEARRQVCEQNGVSPVKFRGMNVIYFLAVERQPDVVQRRIVNVWESDGHEDHRLVFGGGRAVSSRGGSMLVSPVALRTAGATIARLMASGVRRIEDVRPMVIEDASLHNHGRVWHKGTANHGYKGGNHDIAAGA